MGMQDFVFVSGNMHKVKWLETWLGRPVEHHKIDLTEIQSLDRKEVLEHKTYEAYGQLNKPVLVEDTVLEFSALGRLPGTFIKFFLEELGSEGLCKILDGYQNRTARAFITYGLYDGEKLNFFEGAVTGSIAPNPKGGSGHGWDPIFIPEGSEKTLAEMDEEEYGKFSPRNKAVAKLKDFLG
jgi:non-canonical purine NTP pyrophosphatase (RdgB/HAM1 family)